MPTKPTKPAPATDNRVVVADAASAHAPFVYFDEASAYGLSNGIIRVTLEALRIQPATPEEGVKADRVLVAHLRMGIAAAKSLRMALDRALLLAAPAESEAKN